MPNGKVTFKVSVTRTARVTKGSKSGKPVFWLELDGRRQVKAYRTAHGAEWAARNALGLPQAEASEVA